MGSPDNISVEGKPLTGETRMIGALALRLSVIHFPNGGILVSPEELDSITGMTIQPHGRNLLINVWTTNSPSQK